MYSHFVNQESQLNDEQLSAAQRFDELLTAADIQSSASAGLAWPRSHEYTVES